MIRAKEAGDRLTHYTEEQEFLPVPPIAEGLNLPLTILYGDDTENPRTVLIDRLYGPSLDFVSHFRGSDSKSGQQRTFAIDKIHIAVGITGKAIENRIGWLLGAYVRWMRDLPIVPPPFNGKIRMPLIIEADEGDGPFRMTGHVTRMNFGLTPDLTQTLSFHFEGHDETTGEVYEAFYDVLDEDHDTNTKFIDPDTGNDITDCIFIALALAKGHDDRGFEPDYSPEDQLKALTGLA